jgi:hypothetical protein
MAPIQIPLATSVPLNTVKEKTGLLNDIIGFKCRNGSHGGVWIVVLPVVIHGFRWI